MRALPCLHASQTSGHDRDHPRPVRGGVDRGDPTESHVPTATPATSRPSEVQRYLSFFSSTARAVRLVWDTDRRLLVAMAALTVFAGLLPAAMAVVGQRIVDAVVAAQQTGADPSTALAGSCSKACWSPDGRRPPRQ